MAELKLLTHLKKDGTLIPQGSVVEEREIGAALASQLLASGGAERVAAAADAEAEAERDEALALAGAAIDELRAENAALKAEIQKLQAKAAKAAGEQGPSEADKRRQKPPAAGEQGPGEE